jgi:hypothetical protein
MLSRLDRHRHTFRLFRRKLRSRRGRASP